MTLVWSTQADATKSYLKSVHENGVRLPVGPVITSPDGMFRSLHREVSRLIVNRTSLARSLALSLWGLVYAFDVLFI